MSSQVSSAMGSVRWSGRAIAPSLPTWQIDAMGLSERVTFGGSSLDRAAELRGDGAALKALHERPGRAIVLWRGKPLVEGPEAAPVLARIEATEAAVAACPAAFLGRVGDEGLWARDISGWEIEGAPPAGGFLDPTVQHHPAFGPGRRFVELRSVMALLEMRDAEIAATAKALFGWHETHGFCARCGTASEMALAGWQRICPACGAHHFPRTDPVVIMLIQRSNSLLLGRSPGWPEGMYSLLAGFVEPGETIEGAVRREVAEEAGIRVGRVEYLASQPWPFPASLMLGCHGEALSDEIRLDPVELEAAEWVGRERLMRVVAGRDGTIRPPRSGAIAHFLIRAWLADLRFD